MTRTAIFRVLAALAVPVALAGAGLGAVWAAEALAQEQAQEQEKKPKSLQEIEQRLEKGEAETRRLGKETKTLAAEETQLRKASVSAAGRAQGIESEILSLEVQVEQLKTRENEAVKILAEQRRTFARLLGALQRIARYPPEALIAQPLSANDTVRGAILLRSAVPEVERQAEALRRDVETLASARRQIEIRRTELASARQAFESQAGELATLAERKARVRDVRQSDYLKSKQQVAQLAGQAKSLKDLIGKLRERRERQEKEAARAAAAAARKAEEDAARRTAAGEPEPLVPNSASDSQTASILPPAGFTGELFSKQRGRLPFPAVGRIVKKFGAKADSGVAHKGADIRTTAGAAVIAPHEGKVVYAGPFRSYGRLLIIEHGEGYHVLLAGLARLDLATGAWVLAGEPVGVMGRPEQGHPVLYVELRKDGQPIDPVPWLRARGASDAQG
ncbi:MAG: murein hydrolase activator EnvC family protein [Rhodospirillales bacterium]